MTLPDTHPEREEWMFDRAQKLELLLGEDWIEDELRKLWNNPEEYAKEGLYDPSEVDNEPLYALLHLAVGFGTEYEHRYPRDEDEYRSPGVEDA